MKSTDRRSSEILARFLERFGDHPPSSEETETATSRVLSRLRSTELFSLRWGRATPMISRLVDAENLTLEDIKDAEDALKEFIEEDKSRW